MWKRETVFPGSSGWATATLSSPTSEADVQVSAAPRWVPKLRKNPRAPRIDLPINPVHPDSQQPPPVVDGPPWKHYKTAFGLELGGYVAIVCEVPATDRLFSMYSVSGPGRQEKIEMLRSLKHENLLTPEEIFTHEDSSYVITEYAAISLEDLVLVRPDEAQLAAIVGQVMHGICYLTSKSLSHGSITSANILLTTKGVVKIVARRDLLAGPSSVSHDRSGLQGASHSQQGADKSFAVDKEQDGVDYPGLHRVSPRWHVPSFKLASKILFAAENEHKGSYEKSNADSTGGQAKEA